MTVINSENGVITIYVNPDLITENIEISIQLQLPSAPGLKGRNEGFHFILDNKAAKEFAKALL